LVAEARGPSILPNDGVMERCPSPPIPKHRRFPLIGDTNGHDVAGFQAGVGQRGAGDLELAGPNLTRVMLHPSRLREDLFEFLLSDATDSALVIKDNCAGTGRTLIQSQDDGRRRFHWALLFKAICW